MKNVFTGVVFFSKQTRNTGPTLSKKMPSIYKKKYTITFVKFSKKWFFEVVVSTHCVWYQACRGKGRAATQDIIKHMKSRN